MQFLGDNTMYGTAPVVLNEERSVKPSVGSGEYFPEGLRGLLPVMTSRKKKGGYKIVYAFPIGLVPDAEFPAETDAPDGAIGVGDAAEVETATVEPEELTGTDSQNPAPEQSEPAQEASGFDFASELTRAVDFINLLLSEASDFSRHEFAPVDCVWVGINEYGYGFTRVERMQKDEYGRPPVTPIHLRLETSSKPGTPGSTSAVLEYDQSGYVLNVHIAQHECDGAIYHVTAGQDNYAGDVFVQRVTRSMKGSAESDELYYRFWRD